jgi:glycosyltransferase involved in cell wall biosynthesis
MDLCAEMLLAHLADDPDGLRATPLCPPFRSGLGRLPLLGRHRAALNADRLLNRHWHYPRYLRGQAGSFDCFHVVDHSYAHLLDALPTGRTGVFCHDLDAFRCLLAPERDPRPGWFRRLARRTLGGLQKAAVVFCGTRTVREQIERHGLTDPARLVQAPYGVVPDFVPEPDGPEAADAGGPFLLHVGSCIPRKRIDVLLDVFAAVRARHRDLRLVQVGGEWTPCQVDQAGRLGISPSLSQRRGVGRRELAALYRRAAVVLQPSEAEGFGLPVVEALACGSVVVASDLPVLREVGGDAALYCPVADVPAWADTVARLLEGSAAAPDRATRLAQARRYSWPRQAQTIAAAYRRLLATGSPAPARLPTRTPTP